MTPTQEIIFILSIFTGFAIFMLFILIVAHPKTICKNCGAKVYVTYVGSDYRFSYDGRCDKCGMTSLCNREDLL